MSAPGTVGAWLLASRPQTLTAAAVPVLVGTAVAYAESALAVGPALAALFGAIFIQIGTNFANDVFDAEKGADTEERLGPTRAVASGLLSASAMRAGMIGAFSLAMLSGVYLVWVAGWPVVVIGLASIASGIAYTGGPYPLGYNGLGDIFVFVFFGLVAVAGTTFVQSGALSPLSVAAAVPVGALATAILVVNNVRDRHTDVGAGKRTLAVRWGKRGGLVEYGLCLALAYGVPVALALTMHPAAALPLMTLPWGLWLWRALAQREGRPLNAILVGTAQLLLVYGLLWTAALALPRVLA